MSETVVHRHFTLAQIDDLRDAAHSRDARYDSSLRDEVYVVLSTDLGTRVGETVPLTHQMFDLENGEVTLPAGIQKDYPVDGKSPKAATLRLDPYGHFGTVRLLRVYFKELEDDGHDYLFPSRQSDHMSTEAARDIVRRLAVEADVSPRRTDGQPADPSEAHPHAFRHSLANYMLADESTRLVDVRNRLRHRSITTTERVYEHFQRR
ncbi:tyrosine-type recombinase/integrase [Natronosalvus amylolyticus]|uniref:tyrosine-type recombinase/integrase n=1 Tax=Natronosalvus amylolyticus TaxID=2961994 RepID=UPI0020C9893C|nr:tyrosine-type recombinase/integrase [Natronosalvus amylolyticus]